MPQKLKRHRASRAMMILSLFLLCAIGLHTFELQHDHPYHGDHHHGEEQGVSELSLYLHAGERKVFALLPQAVALFPFVLLTLFVLVLPRRTAPLRVSPIDTDYLRASFRRGILHPKLYSSLQ